MSTNTGPSRLAPIDAAELSGCTRGGGSVLDDGWVTRAARVTRVVISMKTRSAVVAFALLAGLSPCLRSAAQGHIDADEIAETPTAKRLLALGFTPNPTWKGEYEAQFTWAKVKAVLGVTEETCSTPASCSGYEWLRGTEIEGNPTNLRHKYAAGVRELQPESIVRVSVNLGYGRPLSLTVGMSSDQLKTALRFAGATPFTVDPTKALPPESRSRETNVLAATLPDGTALVATFRVLDPEHALKPSFPRVTGLFVGAAGQGFDNWNAENARRLDDFPIAKYRKAQRKR